jgi:hypothetical protein
MSAEDFTTISGAIYRGQWEVRLAKQNALSFKDGIGLNFEEAYRNALKKDYQDFVVTKESILPPTGKSGEVTTKSFSDLFK